MAENIYISIDLKSFYASVECVEHGLDPMTTNLVVADKSRTEKTICLAVSPSLKAYGISGRARLFEVIQQVRNVNAKRAQQVPGRKLSGSSFDDEELKRQPEMAVDYLVVPPRMALYMKYSTMIYNIYLKYIAPEDIHVYSIDEVFCDVTHYQSIYGLTPRELAAKMIQDVYENVGITATAGIGTNLYLSKVAMDIVAKHAVPDEYGVRIAELNERTYREKLWNHRPITDFWRVGRGYAEKLYAQGLYTMGDIARCSQGEADSYYNEDLLYRMFGINAELLIDHAWGWEPCTMQDIKAYRPIAHSVGSSQVLTCPYSCEKARLVVREMTDLLALDLVDKKLVTDQIVLTVGYDIENLSDPDRKKKYHGEITVDRYGRKIPKHAHGTANLSGQTASAREMIEAVSALYDRIVDPALSVRRIRLSANHVVSEENAVRTAADTYEQLDLFTDYEAVLKERAQARKEREKEKKLQHAMLDIKKKYGKNAILKGMNLEEGATTMTRNGQIGGHKA